MALDFLEFRDANGAIKRIAVDADPADTNNAYQAFKLAFGPLDTFTLVSTTNGLPVAQQGPWPSSAETSIVYNGTAPLTPKSGMANASSVGDNLVVAAVVGKKIRVLRFSVGPVAGAVNVHFRSGTTAIQSTKYLAANSGYGGAFDQYGHFETAVNTALNINLSAAINVGVDVQYIEV